jgi:hypothetical protein
MQILLDLYCDYFSPAEKRDIMRPGAALAGTRDIKAEIRDIPGNTGLLATLFPGVEKTKKKDKKNLVFWFYWFYWFFMVFLVIFMKFFYIAQ